MATSDVAGQRAPQLRLLWARKTGKMRGTGKSRAGLAGTLPPTGPRSPNRSEWRYDRQGFPMAASMQG